MLAIRNILAFSLVTGVLGLSAGAARADGYIVSRGGPTYIAPQYAPAYVPAYVPAYTPVYVPAPPAYVVAQGYYPAPVYTTPVYTAPVCQPPVVIYRPPVACPEPVRIFHPLDRDGHDGRDNRDGHDRFSLNFRW